MIRCLVSSAAILRDDGGMGLSVTERDETSEFMNIKPG